MAERSNAAVLKTVDGQLSGGSNPSLSAKIWGAYVCTPFTLIEELKPLAARAGTNPIILPRGLCLRVSNCL